MHTELGKYMIKGLGCLDLSLIRQFPHTWNTFIHKRRREGKREGGREPRPARLSFGYSDNMCHFQIRMLNRGSDNRGSTVLYLGGGEGLPQLMTL